MQTLILLLTLMTVTPDCDKEFVKTYRLAAEYVYPRSAFMGRLLPLELHKCDGWLPIDIYQGKTVIRPLYEDSGLPLYDMYEDEWEELVGFEFRSWSQNMKTCKLVTKTLWCCWEDEREIIRGYSIALTEREKFLYAIMD